MATKKLNEYTEKKNGQPPVKIEDAQVIGETNLPETKVMLPVKGFSMPLANVDEIKEASKKYQEFLKALLDDKDVQEIEVKEKVGTSYVKKKKLMAKKSGFGKIARFWGVSTEILRSFLEEHECKNDVCVWAYSNGRSYPKIKRGDKYLIAKAWAKAILPNGQFAVRGAAVSEAERNFAHIPHDLLATCETRAAKRAIEAVIGMGELPASEDEIEEEKQSQPETKTYKLKPNAKAGYEKSKISNPDLPATLKQKDLIRLMRDRLDANYGIKVEIEKPIDELNKGEASDLIDKLMKRGKEAAKNVKKVVPTSEPPYSN